MATRYVTKAWQPVGEWLADPDRSRLAVDIIEPERKPQNTGLLDASGTPIYRVESHDPIGFVRF